MPVGGQHDSTVSSYLSRAAYRNSDRCKRDILGVLQHYNGLKPKLDRFTFNDGRTRDLVCLEGTIPVPYRGSMYNIPVAIWVLDTHPTHAPLCFVRPTPDMQIKVSQHVDGNGKIYLPYLHEWDPSHSDLLGLVQMSIITFGEQPPVFARPQNQAPVPAPQAYPPQPPAYPPTSSYGGYYPPPPPPNPGNIGYPPQPPPPQQQPYPPPTSSAYPPVSVASQPTPYPAVSNSSTISQEHVMMSMRSAVEDMVRRRLREEYALKNVEIQSLSKIRDELNAGQAQLKNAIDIIDRENDSIDRAIRELHTENDKMKEALKDADKFKDATDMKPEDAVTTPTPLYRQLMNAHAEEAAVHEAIYYLGEALKHEIIDCDVFLKQVRKMARKQFFLKATMNKCRKVAGLPA